MSPDPVSPHAARLRLLASMMLPDEQPDEAACLVGAAALDREAAREAEVATLREQLEWQGACTKALLPYQEEAVMLRAEAATLRARLTQMEAALRANQDETWAGAAVYVRDTGKAIRAMSQRYVANTGMAELAAVRAEALEECADGMERAANKARAALASPRPTEEQP
jgi:hypothetical protein